MMVKFNLCNGIINLVDFTDDLKRFNSVIIDKFSTNPGLL